MMWLIRRLLILWLTLIVICFGVIVVARRNPAPDVLQSLGFDVCDGEPCYKGVKVGMDWTEATERWGGVSLVLDYQSPYSFNIINILRADELEVVRGIVVQNKYGPLPTPISIGTLVALYGEPSCVGIIDGTGMPGPFLVQYVGTTAIVSQVYTGTGQYASLHLKPDTPLLSLSLARKSDQGFCPEMYPGWSGRWAGFTSTGAYYDRFRHNANLPKP